jgi:hypothetical protein
MTNDRAVVLDDTIYEFLIEVLVTITTFMNKFLDVSRAVSFFDVHSTEAVEVGSCLQ